MTELLVEQEIVDFTLNLAGKCTNLIGGGMPPPYNSNQHNLQFSAADRYRVTPNGVWITANVHNAFAVGHADKLQFNLEKKVFTIMSLCGIIYFGEEWDFKRIIPVDILTII